MTDRLKELRQLLAVLRTMSPDQSFILQILETRPDGLDGRFGQAIGTLYEPWQLGFRVAPHLAAMPACSGVKSNSRGAVFATCRSGSGTPVFTGKWERAL
ncbi:MAG: hypothetical protein JO091_14210 [Acidobacteriaceae bacterium]|nr:hypothetical protein [Acidobacteriaceae bacterium]